MTAGFSGSYAVNNMDLTLQPTTGKWVERTNYGYDGGGHAVYASTRKFEMVWELISPTDAKQIIDFYNTVSNTGTVTSCLPKWGDANYLFQNYSGTVLVEPEVSNYFQGYIESVKLTILNIRT